MFVSVRLVVGRSWVVLCIMVGCCVLVVVLMCF